MKAADEDERGGTESRLVDGQFCEPWERQPGESPKAYHAFRHYRDSGPGRSVWATSRAVYPTPALLKGTTGPTSSIVFKWAKKFDWSERARLYDIQQDRESRAVRAKEVEAMDRRHAMEARLLQEKALHRLRSLNPDEMSVSEVLKFIVDAAKLERVAMGIPDGIQRVEHTGVDGDPIEIQQKQRVDPEYIGRYLAILAEAGQIPDLVRKIADAQNPAAELPALPSPDVIDVAFEPVAGQDHEADPSPAPLPKRPDIDPGAARHVDHEDDSFETR